MSEQDSRFHFVRRIGKGVLGEVYEVLDEVRQEHVVLKVLIRAQPKNLEEFRLEFASLARFHHPNLVQFFHLVDPRSQTNESLQSEVGQHGLAFTQEFVDGKDLISYLNSAPSLEEMTVIETRQLRSAEVPISEVFDEADSESGLPSSPVSVDSSEISGELSEGDSAEAVIESFLEEKEAPKNYDLLFLRMERVVPQVFKALEHLHRYHKPHGSLRPSNILVSRTEDGDQVKITDYGLVAGLVYCPEKGGKKVPFSISPENLPFLAPEAAQGQVTESGDLFALGCVLFEAIAGFSPHERMEWTQAALRAPPLADCVPECPAEWASLVDGLLEPNPKDRPSIARIMEVVRRNEARPVLLPPSAVPKPTTFVGRQEVLESLKEIALEVADQEEMQFVQLIGEVGSGKSTMVRALSHWLGRRGWVVVRGRFPRRELGPFGGWAPIAEALADLVDQLPAAVQDAIKEHREALSHMLPAITHRDDPGEAHGRLAAISGLREILAEISKQRPLLLCLDDLQWAGWDSSALLLDLLSETEEMRCLVLGTWQEGLIPDEEHLLHTDLNLTLFSTTQIRLPGYSIEEAKQFAREVGAKIDADAFFKSLRGPVVNPLLLRELFFEDNDLNVALDRVISQSEPNSKAEALLRQIYTTRVQELGKRERAILSMLAVSPIPLEHDLLCAAAEMALSSSVVPQDGTESAIESSLELLLEERLIRRENQGFVVAQEPIRTVVEETFAQRDEARYSGKIADVLSREKSVSPAIKFEFERRAMRSAPALEQALKAAEDAEFRYAFHRSAKIWRWILEHEAEIPDYEMIRPTTELARVEHLAGRHTRAAELFHSSASDSKPAKRMDLKLEEAQAWMQAGKVERAREALDAGLQVRDGGLSATLWEKARASGLKWVRGVRFSSDSDASPDVLAYANLLHFALEWSDWVCPELIGPLEVRLTHLARVTSNATVSGIARLHNAQQEARIYKGAGFERALKMVEVAREFFEKDEADGWVAQSHIYSARIFLGRNDPGNALAQLELAESAVEGVEEVEGFDHRLLLETRANAHLRSAHLEDAEHEARHLLHLHRGDMVAKALATRIMAEVALLRGHTDRAARLIDILPGLVEWSEASPQIVENMRLQTKLLIAQGQPEVAVAQLQILDEKYEGNWTPTKRHRALLLIFLGQAMAANVARQKLLSESLFASSLSKLADLIGELKGLSSFIEPKYREEYRRLEVRYEMLRDRPKNALKLISAHAGRESELSALTQACVREARGLVLQKMDKTEGRTELEEAHESYKRTNCACPLVLEGWPQPKVSVSAREE